MAVEICPIKEQCLDYFAAIRAFVRAAEFASFNKAAQNLVLKPSTVSRYISDLERDLGIALFNRSTRGLALTEGGRVFRERALQVLASLEEAREITSSLNKRPQGRLRVTLSVAFCRTQVAPHLPAFLSRYPQIDLDLLVTDDTLPLIEHGIDVAVRIGVLPDSTLMARKLAPHRRIVCASSAYLAARGTPVHPDELRQHECLGFSRIPGDPWSLVRESCGTSERCPVPFGQRLSADESEALLQVALGGFGIAMLPDWLAAGALREGRLQHLLPEWEARSGDTAPGIWAVYPRKKTVSSKVRAFIDFLAKCYGDAPTWQGPPPPIPDSASQGAKRISRARK